MKMCAFGVALFASFILGFVVMLFAWPSCHPKPDPVPAEAGTSDDCASACENLKALGCPGWEGSPGTDSEYGTRDDVSCEGVCIELLESDPNMTLFPLCTSKATTCAEIDLCFEGGF